MSQSLDAQWLFSSVTFCSPDIHLYNNFNQIAELHMFQLNLWYKRFQFVQRFYSGSCKYTCTANWILKWGFSTFNINLKAANWSKIKLKSLKNSPNHPFWVDLSTNIETNNLSTHPNWFLYRTLILDLHLNFIVFILIWATLYPTGSSLLHVGLLFIHTASVGRNYDILLVYSAQM